MELPNNKTIAFFALAATAAILLLLVLDSGTGQTRANPQANAQDPFGPISGTISRNTLTEELANAGGTVQLETTVIKSNDGQYAQIRLRGQNAVTQRPYVIVAIPKEWANNASEIQSTTPYTTLESDPVIKIESEYQRSDGNLIVAQLFTPRKTSGPVDVYFVENTDRLSFHELNNLAYNLARLTSRKKQLTAAEHHDIQDWITNKDWTRLNIFVDSQINPANKPAEQASAITETYAEIQTPLQALKKARFELPVNQLYGITPGALDGFLDAQITYRDPRTAPDTFNVRREGNGILLYADPSGFNVPPQLTDERPLKLVIRVTLAQTAAQSEYQRSRTIYIIPYTDAIQAVAISTCADSAATAYGAISEFIKAKQKMSGDKSGARKLFELTSQIALDTGTTPASTDTGLPRGPDSDIETAEQGVVTDTLAASPCGGSLESALHNLGASVRTQGDINAFDPENKPSSMLVDVRLRPEGHGSYSTDVTLISPAPGGN